jgi:hypothetical protein
MGWGLASPSRAPLVNRKRKWRLRQRGRYALVRNGMQTKHGACLCDGISLKKQ